MIITELSVPVAGVNWLIGRATGPQSVVARDVEAEGGESDSEPAGQVCPHKGAAETQKRIPEIRANRLTTEELTHPAENLGSVSVIKFAPLLRVSLTNCDFVREDKARTTRRRRSPRREINAHKSPWRRSRGTHNNAQKLLF